MLFQTLQAEGPLYPVYRSGFSSRSTYSASGEVSSNTQARTHTHTHRIINGSYHGDRVRTGSGIVLSGQTLWILTIQLTEVVLSIVMSRPVSERLFTLVTETGSEKNSQIRNVGKYKQENKQPATNYK